MITNVPQGVGRGNLRSPPRISASGTRSSEATQKRSSANRIGGSSSRPVFVTTYVLPQITIVSSSSTIDSARPRIILLIIYHRKQ